MAQTNPNVGIIKSGSGFVEVERGGQSMQLAQGDALKWGDVVKNPSNQAVEIVMPATSAGHGDTLLRLEPNSAARIQEIMSPVADGATRTEVIALTEGVELYDISNEVSSAVLVPYEGAMAGLVGAGLLAGGSGAGAALAGLVGVGGIVALASNDNDSNDDTTPTAAPTMPPTGNPTEGGTDAPTDNPTDNPTDAPTDAPTDNPTGEPTDNPTDAPTDNPTDAPTDTPADFAGVVGGLESVNQTLDASPLAPLTAVTGALAGGLGTVGEAVAGFGDQDPTGLANLLGNVVGAPVEGFENNITGVGGLLNSVGTGLDAGAEGSPLDVLLDPVANDVVGTLSGGFVSGGEALAGFADQDPSGVLLPLVSDLLGVERTADSGGDTGGGGDAGGLPIPGLDALPIPGVDALPGLDALPIPGVDALPGLDALPIPGADALPIPGLDALPLDMLPLPGISSASTSEGGLPLISDLNNLLG